MSTNKPRAVNQDSVRNVGGHVLAMQLAGHREPSEINDAHLERLADLSVRAAIALDAAIPRAEERLAAEAKAAEEAEKAAKDAAEKAAADEKAAAETAAQDAKTAADAPVKPAGDAKSATEGVALRR